jgi:hypothetical protein
MASYWKHADDLELEEIDDGFIAYDAARDRVHHLNPTAALVFLLANGQNTAVDIARMVQAQFNLDAAPLDEVETVLDQFSQEGIASPV